MSRRSGRVAKGSCRAGLLNRLTAASEPGKQSQKVYYGDTSHGEKNGNNGIIKRETGTSSSPAAAAAPHSSFASSSSYRAPWLRVSGGRCSLATPTVRCEWRGGGGGRGCCCWCFIMHTLITDSCQQLPEGTLCRVGGSFFHLFSYFFLHHHQHLNGRAL